MPAREIERVTALYDGEIHYTDHHLGRLFKLFERLGLLNNTLVVLTSDHGEEFGEHGSMEGHGWTLYEESLRVPLLMLLPDDRHAGLEVERVVQSIDIAPTILDYLGIEAPSEFQGTSLLPVIQGKELPQRPAFSNVRRWNVKWAVRTEAYKLIFTANTVNAKGVPDTRGFELFDLVKDPLETANIIEDSPEVARELSVTLKQWVSSRPRPPRVRMPKLTERQREMLRALGYIGD
jgi:arylsulfatase A-like enzyme